MLRALVFALWSLLLAGLVFFRYDPRFGHDGLPSLGRRPTYLPYYAAYLLPLCIPILLATLALMGFTRAAEEALSTYVGLFLHISLYHLALLLVLPLLRGRICARTCALLWVIPNLLYFTSSTIYRPAKPLWVLVIPGRWHIAALWVWLAGFLGVLGWHIAGHLRFRRRILAPALPGGVCPARLTPGISSVLPPCPASPTADPGRFSQSAHRPLSACRSASSNPAS